MVITANPHVAAKAVHRPMRSKETSDRVATATPPTMGRRER